MLPIIVTEVLGRVEADLIDIRTKSDGKHIWIPDLKDHFSRFNMLYAFTSKKTSEITYYISLFIYQLEIPGILHCDDRMEFEGALLLFLKKHNIRLVNRRPPTPQTQRLVEQTNALVKDKMIKWQAVNGSGN